MYRTVNDFIQDWQHSSNGTLSIIKAITDEKKDFSIVDGHNSLEWLSWHLTNSPAFFMGQIGLSLGLELNQSNVPSTINEISKQYQTVSENIVKIIKENLSNDSLLKTVNMGEQAIPIGAVLRMMVDHQTHHRAQMQVLLRQAGLPVPGVMGPTKEQLAK
ncbi:DinB family protein [Lysinibacillus telephonicus]|uniref:Damage-inducible protein DinB n=1 Tax=Lysinibacillus telephonicus TaxID=1714840 RepID=A0A431UBX2_9BACI|nr:DinB family protein [Lysinibacillus telephonicus]RTQ86480.1 damage-inducible protein DinB [Lysinibacillus telephonicus]